MPKNRPILKAKKVVRQIVLTLQKRSFHDEVGIQVTEVFMGGSVGQGTAVTGHYDLDLVLYSRDLHHNDVIRDGYNDILAKIERYLSQNLRYGYNSTGYHYIYRKKVALKFRCNIPEGGTIDVDLLLSPYWEEEERYFRDLSGIENPRDRQLFSVNTSKYQTQFVKSTHIRVRELIRRAKAWRNVEWRDGTDYKPKSYLITLLVIAAYDRVNMKDAKFKQLAQQVTLEMIKLVTDISCGRENDLIIPGTNRVMRDQYSHLLPDCPRIVDPVNPPTNVYITGIKGPDPKENWKMLAGRIRGMDITITAERMMKKM